MKRALVISAALLLILSITGCKPDPTVQDPPETPIPPVVIPDCSYSFTVAVQDTNGFYPAPGPMGQQTVYYDGYEITDFSFSPADPNELVIAMRLTDDIDGVGVAGKNLLLLMNLCTGEEQVIFESVPTIYHVDWGNNGKIVFGTQGYAPMCIATINADGSGLEIPSYVAGVDLLEWHPNDSSFLTRSIFSGLNHVAMNGDIINEGLGFSILPIGIDVVPDGRIAFNNGATIGLFNLDAQTSEVIDDQVSNERFLDIAYSEPYNSLLWTTDTMLYLSDIETGQRTPLAYGFRNRVYARTQATSNGYLAYIAHVGYTEFSNAHDIYGNTELRFINPDGTDERRLVLDFN